MHAGLRVGVGAGGCGRRGCAAVDARASQRQVPAYDEKTDAVLLYSETNVTVVSADKNQDQVREAYKILRPDGRQRGTVGFAL